jgi:hypothetical protein
MNIIILAIEFFESYKEINQNDIVFDVLEFSTAERGDIAYRA